MRPKLWIGVLAALLGNALYAQDITGDWQGTLKAGIQELRVIVKIERAANGGWDASLYSIDQSPDWGAGIPANSVTLQGSNLKFTIDAVRGSYEGMLSADGASIAGTLTQGLKLPLELHRATPEMPGKTRRRTLRSL